MCPARIGGTRGWEPVQCPPRRHPRRRGSLAGPGELPCGWPHQALGVCFQHDHFAHRFVLFPLHSLHPVSGHRGHEPGGGLHRVRQVEFEVDAAPLPAPCGQPWRTACKCGDHRGRHGRPALFQYHGRGGFGYRAVRLPVCGKDEPIDHRPRVERGHFPFEKATLFQAYGGAGKVWGPDRNHRVEGGGLFRGPQTSYTKNWTGWRNRAYPT